MNRFTKWAEKEYGLKQRVTATLMAGFLFVFLIPLALFQLAPRIDQWLGISNYVFRTLNNLFGGLLLIVGLAFALWSIMVQLVQAKGTPLPMMATQRLLITGPFRYCRNPMTLGTILLYLGIGVIVGSVSAIILVLVFSFLLILYIKQIEERELEIRFGEGYLLYKKSTPFLLPKIFRK